MSAISHCWLLLVANINSIVCLFVMKSLDRRICNKDFMYSIPEFIAFLWKRHTQDRAEEGQCPIPSTVDYYRPDQRNLQVWFTFLLYEEYWV